MSEDIPIPGGPGSVAAVAAALAIDPAPEPARFISELTRLVYDVPEGKNSATDARLERLRSLIGSLHAAARFEDARVPVPDARVPVPLTTAVWSQAIFRRTIAPPELFAAIVSDRQASLLCYGLSSLDDETLHFLVDHPATLTRLHERSAPAFATFAGSLRVHAGRVVTPGGEAAIPMWEATLGERTDQPERFIQELFEQADGRVAYLYDTIAQVEPAKAAFALGLWIDDVPLRLDRFKALVAATIASYRDWHIRTFPFTRPLHDTAMLLVRIRTDAHGRPALASKSLWLHAFGMRADAAADPDASIDAAWLSDTILTRDLQVRSDRLDQLAFGHRLFTASGDDVRDVLRAFPRCRLLMLTLERMGITDPATYAAAAREAGRITAIGSARGFVALAQFQGAVALLAHMTRVQTIAAGQAAALLDSLLASKLGTDDRYNGAIAQWIDHKLLPALPPAEDAEGVILSALAGKRTQAPRVSWEGQQYRLDPASAELRRLRRVREKQGGYSLDLALSIEASAATLASETPTRASLGVVVERLKTIEPALAPGPRIDAASVPVSLDPSKTPHDTIARAVRDLAHNPAVHVAAVADSLADLGDAVLADTMLSLAYAVDLGDPDGPVLLGGNVARRHDFGLGSRDADARARVTWGLPKADVVPGMPWHVRGSLLGLDVGLAQLALRRINTDRVIAAPVLTSNEREAFAVAVALMDGVALGDRERDAIAAALRRGRVRVLALTAGTFDAAADEIGMDGWRRRAARWLFEGHAGGDRVLSLFSATELLRLGDGDLPAFDAWGMSAYAWLGCLCVRLTPPTGWTLWAGRPQLGVLSSTAADLNLRVAEILSALQLPAALARHVLAAAVQDFVDEVRPTDANDWLALVRGGQAVSRERVEDYVAAAAAADGPLVPEPSPRP